MQLSAIDHQDNWIFAWQAERGKNYFCPECFLSLRLRRGPRMQPHFYHLRLSNKCTLSKKSYVHLSTQIYLVKTLQNAEMESPFPPINRVADVAWKEHKIAFEIQCSKISREEVKARCNDYRKIGYTPIWILDDRRFNKRLLSPAEHYLRSHESCYYLRYRHRLDPLIYDQIEVLSDFKRIYSSRLLLIKLSSLKMINGIPEFLGNRQDFLSKNPSYNNLIEEKTVPRPSLSPLLMLKIIYSKTLSFLLELSSR